MYTLLLQADFNVNMLAELLKQGPVITLLGLACWYFYQQNKKQEAALQATREKHDADIAGANAKLEAYMKEDREELITALNNNTAVMEQFIELSKMKAAA